MSTSKHPHGPSLAAARLTLVAFAMGGILVTLYVWVQSIRGAAFILPIYARHVGNTSSLRQLLRDNQYSPHELLCVGVVLGLLVLQMVLVVIDHASWHRWTPVAIDVAIGFGFAVTSPQIGQSSFHCARGTSCTTTWPGLFPLWWIAVCCGVGVVLGLVWAAGLENERARLRNIERSDSQITV